MKCTLCIFINRSKTNRSHIKRNKNIVFNYKIILLKTVRGILTLHEHDQSFDTFYNNTTMKLDQSRKTD